MNTTYKFLGFLLMSLVMVISISSCGGDDEPYVEPTPTPTPSTSKIDIPATENLKPVFTTEGGTATITFTASQAWTATAANDRASEWLQISPASGGAGKATLTITTKANDTYDDRSATITIKSGNASQAVSVTQKQKDALTVTSDKVEVDGIGGSFTVEVKANIDFEVKTDVEWISRTETRALSTTALQFTASENESTDKREGHITISSGEFSEIVTVFQSGSVPSIVLTKNEYVMNAAGGEISVELRSNVDVTVSKPDVDWISESTTRAMSTHTYVFVISQNKTYDSRTAEIVFTNTENNLREVVSVTQTQQDAIVVAKKEYDVSADGGKLDFDIQTNVDFTVTVSEGWITQADTRALHKETLHFDIAAYEGEEARSAIITIAGGDVTQTITINQRGKASVPKGNIAFEDPRVKEILLMHYFDTNEDGEISYEEAAAITTIKTIFKNTDITSFNEFQYFIGVTEIDGDAFRNCKNLSTIVLPDCLTSIGSFAFFNCENLKSVVIPEGIIKTGKGIFSKCSKLSSIRFMGLVPPIDISTIYRDDSTTNVYLYAPAVSIDIYNKALQYDYDVHRINGIGSADEDNSGNIDFADMGTKLLCVWYFDSNRDGELSYDEAAKVTENDAFCIDEQLSRYDICRFTPYYYNPIYRGETFNEFQHFNGIKSIPKGGFGIDESVKMESITLPSTIETIGDMAFHFHLKNLILLSNIPPTLGSNVFGSNNNLISYIFVPKDAVNTYKSAPGWDQLADKIFAIGDLSTQIIKFEDPSVKSICVKSWDTNKDGELSRAEAAAVKEIRSQFIGSNITSFDEFKYFTGVESIIDRAFEGLESLKSITLPDNLKKVPHNLFYGCKSLNSVILPESLTSIGSWAFGYCESLETIKLPDNLESIGYRTFKGCRRLKSLFIPKGVTKIGLTEEGKTSLFEFFGQCDALNSIVIDPENKVFDSRENSNAIIDSKTSTLLLGIRTSTIPSTLMEIGYQAFYNCSALSQITISESVVSIGESAFYGCTALTKISIPNNVTRIGNKAFGGCSSLSDVSLHNGLETIGAGAFAGCKIASISIPSSVTSLGIYAFSSNKLKSIYIPSSVTVIEGNPFSNNDLSSIVVDGGNSVFDSRNNCNAIIETYSNKLLTVCQSTIIPSGIMEIGDGAFSGCKWLTNIEIPNGVKVIGNSAFNGCTELESISLPDGLTSIGASAFNGCSNLLSIDIPNEVTSIGDSAFWGCRSMKSISFPERMYSLGRYLFAECNNIQSISIPEGIEELKDYTFMKCTNLKTISLPKSLKKLYGQLFIECENLGIITVYAASPPEINVMALYYLKDFSIYVPAESIEAYKNARGWGEYADRIKVIQ